MRAAIYARFSSDLQNPASIADQVRDCRRRADDLGASVVEVYSDAALTGADARHRPALQRLMSDARAGRFDLVIAEALDRVSRDQEDTAAIFKRLSFAGVKLVTLAEGDVGELHVAFRGAMNSLFLRDLGAKVRRGQRGRVAAGSNPGGICYGYRPAPVVGADGEIVRGGRAIHEGEAAVVRRIFDRFLAGVSPRTIAAELNADGIPAPRGGIWRASTVRGWSQRATGILRNPIYAGRVAWNRQRFVRNPETGKRIARPTAAAERVEVEASSLAIVSPETFAAAAARLDKPHASRGRPRPARARRYLLTGLVVCGVCGEPFRAYAAGTMRCRRYVTARSCSNTKTVRVEDLTRRALSALRASLLDPAALDAFCQEYRRARAALASKARQRARDRQREADDLRSRHRRLLDLVETQGTDLRGAADRLRDLEAKLAALEAEEVDESAPIVIAPNLPAIYRRTVDEFLAATIPVEAAEPVRRLIDRIIIHPAVGKGAYRAELVGTLAALFARDENTAGTLRGYPVVAAGRFDPMPPTLKLAI